MPEIYNDVTISTESELQLNRDEILELRTLLFRIMNASDDKEAEGLKEIIKARYGGHFSDFRKWIQSHYGRYEYLALVQSRAVEEDNALLFQDAQRILDNLSLEELVSSLAKLKKLVAQIKRYPLDEFSRTELRDLIAELDPNNHTDHR